VTKQADLIAYVFEGQLHLLSGTLLQWMEASPLAGERRRIARPFWRFGLYLSCALRSIPCGPAGHITRYADKPCAALDQAYLQAYRVFEAAREAAAKIPGFTESPGDQNPARVSPEAVTARENMQVARDVMFQAVKELNKCRQRYRQ
jgi:hypothetical protein